LKTNRSVWFDGQVTSSQVRPGQPQGGPAGSPRTEKVIEMTATQQQGNPVTRFAKTVIRSVRNINGELTGAGEAMARSNRFPQPSPQAGPEQAKQAHPAAKVLAEI
jgi:hypothetical protein